ncbi:hypothetical protein GJ668_12690 [Allochromatium palmeri]|uniref:Uncharacterized protein n=1 Tax=Allochromatium palmeri TaxID=231048 RepID=A0A6N8EGV6_9GAMM|nr:hypothetical protein [Allochromatium palmeri]
MLAQGRAILHWAHRHIGGDTETRLASDLLRRIFSVGGLREYRARYFAPGHYTGVRQALLINMGESCGEADALGNLRCLWIVEQSNRQVFAYRSDRATGSQFIGGTVLREQAVLQADSAFYNQLAMGAASRILATLPVIDDGENLERDRVVLSRIERAVLGHALSLFLDQLPSDVLAAMRTEGAATVEAFNHYLDVNGKPHRNRIQAVQAFPLFGARLRTDWQLRRMVDRGQPLTHALAAAHQVQPRTIQCCRTLSTVRAPDERRVDLLNRLDRLPAEYLPKTEQDWTAFLDLAGSLSDLATTLRTDLVPLIKPFAAGWHSGRTLLSHKLGADFSVQPIYEMMHAVYRYGLYPVLKAQKPRMSLLASAGNAPPPSFFPRWFGRYSLPRLTEMAGQWQQGYRRFSMERLGVSDPALAAALSWPGLMDSPVSYSDRGYRIIELTSQQALEHEGRTQKHCVASYAIKCVLGESAIYSVRDRNTGAPISTFEVALTYDVPVLARHHGRENAVPSPELQAFVQRFVDQVLAKLGNQQIRQVRIARRRGSVQIREFLAEPDTGDQPLSARERARLAELVAFAHPSEIRRLSHKGRLSAINGNFFDESDGFAELPRAA